MFILMELMKEKGYSYIRTERNVPNIRKAVFVKTRTLQKPITIRVDERELEGLSNINDIKYYYNKLIKNVVK